ncbi:MAG TPA: MCE family protein [Actinomycetota bacterium]|nr:MCE family protein [Actinomycetota bacterium]
MRRVLILVILPFALSACLNRSGTITLSADFNDVGDLVRGAGVQTSDIKIGSVTGIELEGTHARVTMRISDKTPLPSNTGAVVRSTSLLGEKFVDLRPPVAGKQGRLRDGSRIPLSRTGRAAGLDDALIKLGQILEGAEPEDLGIFIHSAATIVDGKQDQIGRVLEQLRLLTDTVAQHRTDIGASVDNLGTALDTLADGSATISSALKSGAAATRILGDQQGDLDRLLVSLDRFASVSADLMSATHTSTDASLKDLRLILDKVMLTTDDLSRTLTSLATFTHLWPKAIPGDYIQLDQVQEIGSAIGPEQTSSSFIANIWRAP